MTNSSEDGRDSLAITIANDGWPVNGDFDPFSET
jgi:hypothetical protein